MRTRSSAASGSGSAAKPRRRRRSSRCARSRPASAYPERLLWQHLHASGFALAPLPCRSALVSDGGGARSPHAKLARDFPSAECPYPAPYEAQADLRLATERLSGGAGRPLSSTDSGAGGRD